jgi:signal transduction histidine kinase
MNSLLMYVPFVGTVALLGAAVAILVVGRRHGRTLSSRTLLPAGYLVLHAAVSGMLFLGQRFRLDRDHVHMLATSLDLIGIVVLGLAIWDMDRMARSVRRDLQQSKREAREYERARLDYEQLMRHRIANPLTVVSGGIATLREYGDNIAPETRALLLDDIAEALERLELVETVTTPVSVEELCLDAVPHVSRRSLAIA